MDGRERDKRINIVNKEYKPAATPPAVKPNGARMGTTTRAGQATMATPLATAAVVLGLFRMKRVIASMVLGKKDGRGGKRI